MDFFELIAMRESCRDFANHPVEHEKLVRCLEAARVAPSASNGQPWSFIAIESAAVAPQVAKCLQTAGMNQFASACPCFVTVVEEESNLTARFGARMKKQDYSATDIGIAATHFCLAATAQGLSTCIVGWFDEPALKTLLDIPEKKRVRLVLCVGYAGNPGIRAKVRKTFDEIVTFR